MNKYDLVEIDPSYKKYPSYDLQPLSPETPEEEEGNIASFARTVAQIPQGLLDVSTYGIMTGLWQILGMGEVFDPSEIEHIKNVSEKWGIPFDEEAYIKAGHEALGMIPTVSNIASFIEEKTGLPLEPKTRVQKGLRFATSAGKLAPQPGTLRGLNTPLSKPLLGAGVEATKEAIQEMGVPEPLSEILSFAILKQLPENATGTIGLPSIGKKRKPSGMVERRFENLKEKREVPTRKIEQISEKLESDFRDISKKIVDESPIGETAKNIVENPAYKAEVGDLIEEAQKIADSIPTPLPTKSIKKEIADVSAKNIKGISLSEYEKSYLRYMKEHMNEIVPEKMTAGELIEQYRKNNDSLTMYFEPGSSRAINYAKRDALLDYNRAIAKVIEKVDPELSAIFKEGNSRWTKIMDYEAVDSFVNEMFKEGMNYAKMKDFFNKKGYRKKFQRALGEEGFKQFEQLMKDILTTETPYKMLKVAKENGFGEFFSHALAFVVHPKIGKAWAIIDSARKGFRTIINRLLDKPKLVVDWKRGVDNLKKGNFKAAAKDFEALKAEIEVLDKEAATAKPSEIIEAEVTPIEEAKRIEAPQKKIEHREHEVKEVAPLPTETKAPELPDTRGKGKIYHGTPQELQGNPNSSHYNSINYYGQGFYTTDAMDIAQGYASRKGKAKQPTIYEVTERHPVKLYDMEKPLDDKLRAEIEKLRYNFEIKDIAENKKLNLRQIYDELRESSTESADTIQGEFDVIREILQELGYDGMKHIGGLRTNKKPHEVKIYFNPEKDIEIKNLNAKSSVKESKEVKPVETVIKEQKKNDLTPKGMKAQKAFIIETLENAIDHPTKAKQVIIDVPGDGKFKVNNEKTVLEKVLKKIRRSWPTRRP